MLATVAERTPLRIVPTFLGAHLLPEPGYLDLLVEEMLPACAPLAEGCDAFCDLGALTVFRKPFCLSELAAQLAALTTPVDHSDGAQEAGRRDDGGHQFRI